MAKYNFYLLNDRQLFEQEASGHFTELDSVPALIFEILFGEVI